MIVHTELLFKRLNYAILHKAPGEKLWLGCLLNYPVCDVKTRIINYLSTMMVVYTLFCVFAGSDIITPISTDNDIIRIIFFFNASIEMYTMLLLLSVSSAMYLYVILMNDKTDTLVHFISKFNWWISWLPIYGVLLSSMLQITNIIFRIYIVNFTLVITQASIGLIFLIFGYLSLLRVSFFIHNMLNEDFKNYPQLNNT